MYKDDVNISLKCTNKSLYMCNFKVIHCLLKNEFFLQLLQVHTNNFNNYLKIYMWPNMSTITYLRKSYKKKEKA